MDEIVALQREGQHVRLDELMPAVAGLRLDVHPGDVKPGTDVSLGDDALPQPRSSSLTPPAACRNHAAAAVMDEFQLPERPPVLAASGQTSSTASHPAASTR